MNGATVSLSRNQFDVLFAFHRGGGLTQRQLKERTGLGLGTVNSTVRELEALGYVEDRQITGTGTEALGPYKVDNAVILAAGLSERFAPISYEKPKGILRVRGEVLIERQIEQLIDAGVSDITVVVGYKQGYFFYLRKKYGVRIAVNEDFASRNNNGSMWVIRERLANTYVCSSDDYFTVNPFESHVYQAYYAAQYVEGETDEWCLTTGSGGRITGVSIGGRDAWVMLGHVYFDRAFSSTFRRILEEVYHFPETAGKLWEVIYVDHLKDLRMVKREYSPGIINEFDSLDELRGFDPSFIENVDSEAFDNIVRLLGCERSEIHDFYPLKQGITNLSCHFTVDGEEYVYRHPGVGTEKMIDREAEIAALELASKLGLDKTFIYGDPARGWKISRFIPGSRNLDAGSKRELKKAMKMSRRLHNSGETLEKEFDFIAEGMRYERLLLEHGPIGVPGYAELREKVMRLKAFADADNYPLVPSHNDFFPLNFLVNEERRMSLIDWEYAGMSDVANDFGTFTVCAELSRKSADKALSYYFSRPPTPNERRHFWAYVVFAGWCWYVWALAKEAEGDNVGEWLYIYYRHAAEYVDEILSWYEHPEVQAASPIDEVGAVA